MEKRDPAAMQAIRTIAEGAGAARDRGGVTGCRVVIGGRHRDRPVAEARREPELEVAGWFSALVDGAPVETRGC